ncbi:sugar ABC transporter ATP-binding protein [Longimicrobium terrae]|uniref:Ribose transport system ATP-binding protein n=1 Tax=Longimicrobium terrae TaxID=1639882 RepID=A0A841GWN2_9BACT|nr:sugar ABC transporter ATP-binding protein [Longimicrobium terrae]MBB4635768.1 ribose transport system ATP-binding protein [Longimicrobium terrae]MBB6070163.1 ribose transport system ATP-binding protein [Longimicrobium terrae]NNC33064.1 sugar ABC transporter ATP-binding protein [Longimicrobium terrae]
MTSLPPDSRPEVLRMEGIVKRFAGATALDGVNFTLRRGEVHALVGENGAGKSTLIKIMTGAYRRDGGEVWVEGQPVSFGSPADAQAAGVIAVHQEIHLLSFRTVAENVYLGREPRRWGLVDWRRMRTDTAELLQRLGLAIDPDVVLGSLSTAQQQMVAIARGVSLGAKVLVLDEPTSSLAEREVAILYDMIRHLQSQGTSIVYISHRFDELYAVCDRTTVLRDGRLVATHRMAELERLDLVCLMLGKARDELRQGTTAFAGAAPEAESAEPLLRTDGLRRGQKLRGVSLDVRRGEILGVAGLLGSGRTETARAIFGADPAEDGGIQMDGKRITPRTPDDAIRAGIAFVSEDRKGEGIIPELSVRENLTLAALPTLTRAGIVDRAKQREIVDRYMKRLGIKATSADQKIRELSGGNQQKVLLARWLCMSPALLILDEPTRGIDIGAKGEIQALINELAGTGLGVLMISSELEELVEGSSRVVVLRDGQNVAELRGSDISQQSIIHAMAEGSAVSASPALES